tara:strand:+ start:2404 stop:3711 length:1308 start_codon:yes stop_codon:yes gene_type:complete
MAVYQHWDPLKAVLVGRSYAPEFYSYIKNPKVRNVMERIAIETEEDYQKLISKLKELGVETVLRTDIVEDESKDDAIKPYPPMTPRDYTAMVGDTWFQPGGEFGRNFDVGEHLSRIRFADKKYLEENDSNIAKYVYDLLKPGRNLDGVTSLDRMRDDPDLRDFDYVMSALDTDALERIIRSAETNTMGSTNRSSAGRNAYRSVEKWMHDRGTSIQYDKYINTANMTRVGKDLYFGLNNIVNYLNKDYFMDGWKRLFPNNRVHAVASPGHIDGSFSAIKPGLVLTNISPQHYEETFPDWEIVDLQANAWEQVDGFIKVKEKNRGRWWVPGEEDNDDLADFINTWLNDWVLYVEETVFDVNLLVVDEKNVIVNGYNKAAFDAFERHGVTPHIVNLRHRFFWDGGLHCVTSDLHREGTQQDYFPDRTESMLFLDHEAS